MQFVERWMVAAGASRVSAMFPLFVFEATVHLLRKVGLAIQQWAVRSPRMAEHCRVLALSFTSRNTRRG